MEWDEVEQVWRKAEKETIVIEVKGQSPVEKLRSEEERLQEERRKLEETQKRLLEDALRLEEEKRKFEVFDYQTHWDIGEYFLILSNMYFKCVVGGKASIVP
jgi:uncharacterized protein YhaN